METKLISISDSIYTALQCCEHTEQQQCRIKCIATMRAEEPSQWPWQEMINARQLATLKEKTLNQIESYCGKPSTNLSTVTTFDMWILFGQIAFLTLSFSFLNVKDKLWDCMMVSDYFVNNSINDHDDDDDGKTIKLRFPN